MKCNRCEGELMPGDIDGICQACRNTQMLIDPDSQGGANWHGDEEDGKLKKASPFYEPERLLYTASDMERARADERARIFVEIDKLYEHAELTGNVEAMDSLNVVELAIRSLGPVGDTREETEARVRRQTCDRVRGWIYMRCDRVGVAEKMTVNVGDVLKGLDAIAEGGEG